MYVNVSLGDDEQKKKLTSLQSFAECLDAYESGSCPGQSPSFMQGMVASVQVNL